MRYYEQISPSSHPNRSTGADIAQHWQPRQYLGAALVITDRPIGMMCVARKQWLRLARNLQTQRASTLNAERLVRLTHGITHMQHTVFTTKHPLQQPGANMYFTASSSELTLPHGCLSLYITCAIPQVDLTNALNQLPPDALVIDYTHELDPLPVGLSPKSSLTARMHDAWKELHEFFTTHRININLLADTNLQSAKDVDNALDILMTSSHEFLRCAISFQHLRELAQPVHCTNIQRRAYDIAAILAYRVQMLLPGPIPTQFSQFLSDNNSAFFLRDSASELMDELLERRVLSDDFAPIAPSGASETLDKLLATIAPYGA